MANINQYSPMLTYKSFIDDLIATISTHKQVNTCCTGLIADFSTPKLSTNNIIVYPYVFLMNDSFSVDVNNGVSFMTVFINLIISDQFQDQQEAIIDVQSNMNEIALDIIASYTNVTGCSKPYRMFPDQNITIHPFVEKDRDSIAGVELTIGFVVEQPLSREYLLMTNV